MARHRLLLLTLLFPAALHAGSLQWESPQAVIEAVEGGGRVGGEFRFTNTSDRPVSIRSVPVSCGCIAPKPEKRAYAPGESGSIPFTYTPKQRWGTKAYRVFVVTNEGGRPYELGVVVTETRRAAP